MPAQSLLVQEIHRQLLVPTCGNRESALISESRVVTAQAFFAIPLLSGDNQLTAVFEGVGADESNSDMPGIKLMNSWLARWNRTY